MPIELAQINGFFSAAALATYAGNGAYSKPWNKGFNEMEYKQGDWHYRDSFTGYFKSFGREVIWYKGSPVWTQHYGGGIQPEYKENLSLAKEVFAFLKQALASGNRAEGFRPRGPKEYEWGDWIYRSGFTGNMAKFSGSEEIFHQGKLVFTHHYFGGAVVDRETV